MAKKNEDKSVIDDAKIRVVIWMIKSGKTKKACCEYLGIAYNTKRLDIIVSEFQDKQARAEELKKAARKKELSDADKKNIVKAYLAGESISAIAKDYYLTFPRIKKVIMEANVPIRGRGKNTPAKTEHVVQDLDQRFTKGDKIYFPRMNSFARVVEVYDEEHIERLKDVRKERYVKVFEAKDEILEKEGIHFEVYYTLGDGSEWKRTAIQALIQNIEDVLSRTGREYYRIWVENDGNYTALRSDLVPVQEDVK